MIQIRNDDDQVYFKESYGDIKLLIEKLKLFQKGYHHELPVKPEKSVTESCRKEYNTKKLL